MKRFFCLCVIALLVIPCVALAIQLDLTILSIEELQALKNTIEAEIASRTPNIDVAIGVVDGFTVSIDRIEADKTNNLLTVYYTFSHTEQEPQNFMKLWTQVYQGGLECDTAITSDQYSDLFRKIQANIEYSVSKTYVLYNLDSDVDCVVLSWNGLNKEERVESTFSIQ